MKAAICAVFLAVLPLTALAQIEFGTLILLDSSPDEIVVAADSRAYSASTQFDNRCKITALGNQVIFAASGKTALPSADARIEWDSHTIARDIFRRLRAKKTNQPMPMRLAKAWGRQVQKKLELDIQRDRKETLSGVKDDLLTSALFAGFDQNAPYIVTGFITYGRAPNGSMYTHFSIGAVSRRAAAVQLGKTDIATELFAQKTERAIQWRKSLRIENADDRIAIPVISALQFSIENYPPIDLGGRMVPALGGPIDAVRLTRTQGIQWIQRKPNCPEN
jgi:hypothetical protein